MISSSLGLTHVKIISTKERNNVTRCAYFFYEGRNVDPLKPGTNLFIRQVTQHTTASQNLIRQK